jgi:tRNA G18 (ribose-2'-O)-methylase SpoU
MINKKIILILENIRSLHNVGAMFRSADACNVSCIYLVGPSGIITPQVLNPKLAKTSLGTEKSVPWKHFWTIDEAIDDLPKNTDIIALEQANNSKNIFLNLKSLILNPHVALIVGNEISGVSQKALEKAADVVSIPMLGKHNSLNVACSTSVALYQILECHCEPRSNRGEAIP